MIKDRVIFWDIAKAFGMLLVVYGHLMFTYDSRGINTPINHWIYSFHMALFFMISGFFFSSSLKKDFLTLLKNKSVQLLVPVISWSIISFIINELFMVKPSEMRVCVYNFCKSGGVLRGLWFLKALFIYYMTAYIAVRILKNEWIAGILCILLLSIMPKFNFIAIFPAFFWTGHFIRKYNCWLHNRFTLLFSMVLSAFSLILWKSEYSYIAQNMDLVSIGMRLLAGISWSLTIIMLSKKISEVFSSSSVIDCCAKIGSTTMGIYCMHETLFLNVWWNPFYATIQHDNDFLLFFVAVIIYACTYGLFNLLVKFRILKTVLFG